MIPLCVEEGIGLIPYSPLARGFVAGNRRVGDFGDTSRSKTDELAKKYYYAKSDFEIVERIRRFQTHRWPWRGSWLSGALRRRSWGRAG
jgi:aryl-alcohol dehydrogenase (NADP+)